MICVRKKSCATLPQQMGKPGGNGRFPRIRELSKKLRSNRKHLIR